MKKIILILTILLLTGCSSACKCECPDNSINDEELISAKKVELEKKLLEYGKLIYENDNWLKGGVKPDTYYMNLQDMSERNHYDISMFVNPVTNEKCDIVKTRIEFIVEKETVGKTEYKYNTNIECGF